MVVERMQCCAICDHRNITCRFFCSKKGGGGNYLGVFLLKLFLFLSDLFIYFYVYYYIIYNIYIIMLLCYKKSSNVLVLVAYIDHIECTVGIPIYIYIYIYIHRL